MRENRIVIGERSKLFCGLYLPSLQDENNLTKAIKTALDNGSDGVSFFSIGGLNENTIN